MNSRRSGGSTRPKWRPYATSGTTPWLTRWRDDRRDKGPFTHASPGLRNSPSCDSPRPAHSPCPQLVAAFLFELSPRDPSTLLATAVVLMATTMAAGWLPARRAAAVDPMRALRNE